MEPSKHVTANDPFRERVERTRLRLLDVVDDMVASLHDRINPPALPAPPRAVLRRMVANGLGLWQLCANSKCRRSKSCRGEPRHCLYALTPLVQDDALDKLLPRRPARASRRASRLSAAP